MKQSFDPVPKRTVKDNEAANLQLPQAFAERGADAIKKQSSERASERQIDAEHLWRICGSPISMGYFDT